MNITRQFLEPTPLISDENTRIQARFFSGLILGITAFTLIYIIAVMLMTNWASTVNLIGLSMF